ncbi:TPA: type II restriction endonuclease [Vibrio parahaemolyticus]|nr:type II restriction endonuclease [Vibrio parahaemolyticus]
MAREPIHFDVSCLKTLTAVEAERNRSNQHEFQGVSALRSIFGVQRTQMEATFSIRGETESYSAMLTWYDARENQSHRSAEYRLYFQSTPVMNLARAGDSIVIGRHGNHVYCELIRSSSPDYQGSPTWVNV